MPFRKRWYPFMEWAIVAVPDAPGAYELGDRNREILCIGSTSTSLREILRRLYQNKMPDATRFRFEITQEARAAKPMERVHLRRFRQRYGRPPRYQHAVQRASQPGS